MDLMALDVPAPVLLPDAIETLDLLHTRGDPRRAALGFRIDFVV